MVDIAANTSTKAVLEGNTSFGTFSGVLETAGDHDWIKVDLVAGFTYQFYLSFLEQGSVTSGDATITLRNASGVALIGGTDNNGGVGANSLLSFPVVTTGTYFIDISEVGNRIGEYGLVVALPSGTTDQPLSDANDDDTGAASERILGGKGSDFINIGFGVDALGEQGNDIIFGNGAANKISGGIGSDTIDGGGESDIIFGDAGDDILSGGDGFDLIRGGAGSDFINGGNDSDGIVGGIGKDFLTGGSAADAFVFSSVGHSRRGATRDVITDFSQLADDLIHLFDIDAKTGPGNQAFKFIGQAHFHDKAGELRFALDVAHNRTFVQGDVNGDGKADIEIQLTDLHALTVADFQL